MSECPVLFETFTSSNPPISLPCGHSISRKAAEGIKSQSLVRGSQCRFRCPICNTDNWITTDHVFPVNYSLLSLIEEQQQPIVRSSSGDAPLPPTMDAEERSLETVTPPYQLQCQDQSDSTLTRVVANDELATRNTPLEVFVACDVSGSMDTPVNATLGLTRLDLVKYNVEMLLRRLATLEVETERPRITLVTFTDSARVLVDRQPVGPENLQDLISKVQSMRALYTTNIRAAIQTLCDVMVPGNHNIAVLLTDGQPTDSQGIIAPDHPASYLQVLNQYKGVYSSFSTIGYGHHLSHRIMLETARAGGGVASFGSDESMVSNVFIRWLSWALITLPTPPAEVTFTSQRANASSYRQIIPAMVKGKPYQYIEPTGMYGGVTMDGVDKTKTNLDVAQCGSAQSRLAFCRALERSILLRDRTSLDQVLCTSKIDPTIQAECKPDGQIGMAFKPEYFQTWGQAYLYATLRGHEMAHQWNFKDESLKGYCHPDFDAEVDKLDRIFKMMPPPTPSKSASESVVSRGGMSQVFNNSNSTCWAYNSVVSLATGEDCLVQNLRAGNWVTSFDPKTRQPGVAQVEFVVRQPCSDSQDRVVCLGERGLARLTKNHPILDLGASPTPSYRWAHDFQYSQDSQEIYTTDNTHNFVYNMVLSQHHHVMSDGVVCVTMGHGMTEEKVAQFGLSGRKVVPHTYFGDYNRVVNDLRQIGPDRTIDNGRGGGGYVTVDPNQVVRDPETGWIISLV